MSTSNGFQGFVNESTNVSAGSSDAEPADPASNSFFSNDYKKHQDITMMLDSNKDTQKLEAMKRLISMVAMGKDASDLFPAVVKNVVSKNIEVKKLVYVYLCRYAEEKQDLALLSISTFQRSLKDPNQLIRASALRVLSSIRVPMITPIMMLAIREAVSDMSPYVRKTAAHAIPKLYSLDVDQKESLIEQIQKLLADKSTLVAGSAVQAFVEVCPERLDLIHKNYIKLCQLLADVEEWGQVIIINMMTRYARTQFLNPNAKEYSEPVNEEQSNEKFYPDSPRSSSSSSDDDKPRRSTTTASVTPGYTMDKDYRTLLRACKPLLASRNSSVVMAVAQLYHHCAPRAEVACIARALIRLLRHHKEIQYIVLGNIATMVIERKEIFEPHLKSFYVRSNDSTHVKLHKLEILTTLATETNISTILREFQTYVTSCDKQFAAASIQAIGRCASSIAEVTDICLNGLVNLLSNHDGIVVGECVIVIKKLLQMQPTQHREIISHLASLVDTISIPMARASIVWLIGEYSERVPKIAPDVLRKMAKTFTEEKDIVKLQTLNLAAKLYITNPQQTRLLVQYVFSLSRYDLSYDIRDRTRMLRALVVPNDKQKSSVFCAKAKKIFFTKKPAPLLRSKFTDQEEYQLGTLSHAINARSNDYRDLPRWPLTQPDTSVRAVAPVTTTNSSYDLRSSQGRGDYNHAGSNVSKTKKIKNKPFYSDEETSSSESESDSDSSGSASSSDTDTDSDSDGDSTSQMSGDTDSDSDSDSDSESDTDTDTDANSKPEKRRKNLKKTGKAARIASSSSCSGTCDSSSDSDSITTSCSSSPSQTSTASDSSCDSTPPPARKSTRGKKYSNNANKKSDKKISTAASPTHAADATAKVSSKTSRSKSAKSAKNKSEIMLLDLDFDMNSSSQSQVNQLSSDLSSLMLQPTDIKIADTIPQTNIFGKSAKDEEFRKTYNLLDADKCHGLSATYRYTRELSIWNKESPLVSVALTFVTQEQTLSQVKISDKITKDIQIEIFAPLVCLEVNCSQSAPLHIDFRDTSNKRVEFTINTAEHPSGFKASITPPIGELLRPSLLSSGEFTKLRGVLSGMNENKTTFDIPAMSLQQIHETVLSTANVQQVSCETDNVLLFSSKTAKSCTDVLITIVKKVDDESCQRLEVTVNCEKMLVASQLMKALKNSFVPT